MPVTRDKIADLCKAAVYTHAVAAVCCEDCSFKGNTVVLLRAVSASSCWDDSRYNEKVLCACRHASLVWL